VLFTNRPGREPIKVLEWGLVVRGRVGDVRGYAGVDEAVRALGQLTAGDAVGAAAVVLHEGRYFGALVHSFQGNFEDLAPHEPSIHNHGGFATRSDALRALVDGSWVERYDLGAH
jgi:hypothetical protein